MNWSSNSRPEVRLAGLVCTLLRVGLFVMGVGGQLKSLADVPPLYFTNSSVPSSGVGLAWDPSPDTNVVGYLLCWGTASGQCTNQLDAGDVTSATLSGFTTNTTYYFDVVAYNAIGQQADPSNEVQYSLTNSIAASGAQVAIQPGPTGTNLTAIFLSFQGSAGATYAVMATQDFVEWDTIWITNCATDVAVVLSATDVTNYVRRFYRVVRTN